MSSSPKILIVGATGNTGKNVVRTLSRLQNGAGPTILALTRSADSPAAQSLAKLEGVKVLEQDWTSITPAWLKQHHVERVFIAPHNGVEQFHDESNFYLALLQAGVKYLVKISTNPHFTRPDGPFFYGRAHWAIENLLSQPAYAPLQWTSIRPNYFNSVVIPSTVNWIQNHRKTGKQQPFVTMLAEDYKIALVDPNDIGEIAAQLLALEDPSEHNK